MKRAVFPVAQSSFVNRLLLVAAPLLGLAAIVGVACIPGDPAENLPDGKDGGGDTSKPAPKPDASGEAGDTDGGAEGGTEGGTDSGTDATDSGSTDAADGG